MKLALFLLVMIMQTAWPMPAHAQTNNGLVGWWRFDEGSGTSTTADSSGNGNTGNLTASPSWVTGRYGKALSFNGSSQYVTATSAFTFTNAVTFSAWLNTGTSGGVALDSSITGMPSGRDQFQIFIASSSTIRFASDNGSFFSCTGGSVTYTNNVWHLMTGVYNGTVLLGYIDGKQVCSQNASGSIGSTVQLALMGKDGVSGNGLPFYYTGIMDDVRIYNRALSSGEVYELFVGGGQTHMGVLF